MDLFANENFSKRRKILEKTESRVSLSYSVYQPHDQRTNCLETFMVDEIRQVTPYTLDINIKISVLSGIPSQRIRKV